MNPYQVVKDFEEALCDYTGAKYAVTTNSCTNAILVAASYQRMIHGSKVASLPSFTYVGVPMAVKLAGHKIHFDWFPWSDQYPIRPLNIMDAARTFTSDMYVPGYFQCVSFHWSKILAIGQGGAILHDNDEADAILRRMRFDGRAEGVAPKDDTFPVFGWHCYMRPSDAAEGLSRLAVLPEHNEWLRHDDYPNLEKIEIFK